MNPNSIEVPQGGATHQQPEQTSILRKGKYCKYDPNVQVTQGSLFGPEEQMSSQALDTAQKKSTNGMISIAELLKQ